MDKCENINQLSKSSKESKSFEDSDRGPDYYIENGLLVFTEAYHLKRGHCCKNACRHCPYGYKRKS